MCFCHAGGGSVHAGRPCNDGLHHDAQLHHRPLAAEASGQLSRRTLQTGKKLPSLLLHFLRPRHPWVFLLLLLTSYPFSRSAFCGSPASWRLKVLALLRYASATHSVEVCCPDTRVFASSQSRHRQSVLVRLFEVSLLPGRCPILCSAC